jgi:nucleotide sugar dehydrogenase
MSEQARVKVGIIGLGMVGTPIRRWFQEVRGYERGVDLFCYDADPTLPYKDDYNDAQLVFVAVPSPPNPDGSCNTSIVRSVVGQLTGQKLVAVKSTVPPGTTADLQREFPRHLFMFNPEFLTEKQAWEDFLHPFRQLIGSTREAVSSAVQVLNMLPQASFCRPWAPVYGLAVEATSTEAELAKYASNVFGAMKVVFANILADTCFTLTRIREEQVDYASVRDMLGADPRITPAWLDANHGNYNGFGGYCFPKDLAAFIEFYRRIIGEYVLLRLSAGGLDEKYHAALHAGLRVLESVYAYNTALLAAQGLTVADVSQHDSQIIIKDRHRPIRS